MSEKNSSKIRLSTSFIFATSLVFMMTFFYFIHHGLILAAGQNNLIMTEQIIYGLPTQLDIPRIGIKAVVKNLGLTSDGAVPVPKGTADVAWLNLGVIPGNSGSAVITGHAGWEYKQSAVFDNLYQLRSGDKIYIKDEWGNKIPFIVQSSQIYRANADIPKVFFQNDGKSHLNLITCVGAWNAITQTYADRLVVFADRE